MNDPVEARRQAYAELQDAATALSRASDKLRACDPADKTAVTISSICHGIHALLLPVSWHLLGPVHRVIIEQSNKFLAEFDPTDPTDQMAN